MQIAKKIRLMTEDDAGGGSGILSLSERSAGVVSNTGTLCSTETPNVAFYIFSSTKPIVTSGDMAYNTNNLSSPYNGASKYFNVAFGGFAGDTYIVQIDSFGEMTVIESCPI